jgi:Fe-S-cluster-containing dehydrogenase component
MIRTSDLRTVRLDDELPSHLAALLFRYGVNVAVSDPDLCLHCRQHQCVAVCPSGSLSTAVDGRIAIDQATCCGCVACIYVCREFNNLAMPKPQEGPTPEN